MPQPEKQVTPPMRKPVIEFPIPNTSVIVVTERVNRTDPAYLEASPMQPGALYSATTGANTDTIAAYPHLAFLREVKYQDDDQIVTWFWSTVATKGWKFSSHLDEQTGIVGNIAKCFVGNSRWNAAGQYIGVTTINGLVFGGGVAAANVTAGGSGYTSPPAVVIAGLGNNAVGVATIAGGAVTGIKIIITGSGYVQSSTTIRLIGGNGTGATATVTVSTGDLIIAEYQEYEDEVRQVLLVSTFSAYQIGQLSEVLPIEGDYPIPPTLTAINVHNDSADWAYAYSDASNYSWQIEVEINGTLEFIWLLPPTKLIGVKTRTYSIGTPDPPNATQIFPTEGEIIELGATLRAKQDAWANSTASGAAAAASVDSHYGKIPVRPCLLDNNIFASLPTAVIPTVSFNGYQVVWSALTGTAGYSTNIKSSSPTSYPSQITEYATEKQPYEIYVMDVIVWGVGYTPPVPASGTATAVPGMASNSGTGDTWFLLGVGISNRGSGYTSVPTVHISAPPAGGTQATAHAVLTGGSVTSIVVDDHGGGYPQTGVTITVNPPPGP